MKVVAVVGAQAGSEGKGAVVAAIADYYNVHVRTGGPNAGHTFYHGERKFVGRGLPCGWVNPKAQLVIGPGAVLDWKLLLEEVEEVEAAGYKVKDRLFVSPKAVCVTDAQHRAEGGVGGHAHKVIGSTGEGVGMARISRISRRALLKGAEFATVRSSDVVELDPFLGDYVYQEDDNVLLEGTQGSKLSLIHGPWPYVTSADTNAAQLCADAGISPGRFSHTILVARAFPIRVAGDSGPLPLETTWAEIGVPEERTTVTLKVRRVGRWDAGWVRDAIRLNEPCLVVVTFVDYLFPSDAGATNWHVLSNAAQHWIRQAEEDLGVVVVGVGTGPETIAWRPGYPR